MEEKAFWELFLDTGSPEAYLLYRRYCRESGREQGKRNDITLP